METKSRRQNGRDGGISSLNSAIDALELARDAASVEPVKEAFRSAVSLLATIKESADKSDCVELGLACADVCQSLDRKTNGRRADQQNQSVLGEAIERLTTTVNEIQKHIVKRNKRNAISRRLHAKDDEKAIVAWGSHLDKILHALDTEFAVEKGVKTTGVQQSTSKTDPTVPDLHRGVSDTGVPAPSEVNHAASETHSTASDIHHEAVDTRPAVSKFRNDPTNPRTVSPITHHGSTKNKKDTSGQNRPAYASAPGDSSPPSRATVPGTVPDIRRNVVKANNTISKIQREVEEIKQTLQTREDNGDENRVQNLILEGAGEIYSVIEELSQLSNIWLLITSRISTIPPDCEILEVPTLSGEAAGDTFYRIYKHGRRVGLVNGILENLDFHPLSITLLATVAHQNKWDIGRLKREWEDRRTGVLKTGHNKSLSATIELSLASPTFQDFGSDAREFLSVVAFFPQGVSEEHLGWFFPAILNRSAIFDGFCVLSLAYRGDGFIRMLAPLSDYLAPKDPLSSPLLCMVKDYYTKRLSDYIDPEGPSFKESRWITSEDVNVERLLDVFTFIGPSSGVTWGACAHFFYHLYSHKPRHVVLGPKVEQLPDDHPSKIGCLFRLGQLLALVGNYSECKRLLVYALKLVRDQGIQGGIALILVNLSNINEHLRLYPEAIQQAKEASEIFEQLNNTSARASCLVQLAGSGRR